MYHFVTNWYFNTPIEMVWDEASNLEAYPSLCPNLRRAKIREPESKLKLGSIVDCEVKGALPYTVRFSVEVIAFQPPTYMELKSWGDLVGYGKCLLERQGEGTACKFHWDVETTKPIFNLLARIPFFKAILEKNHNYVMAKGYEVIKSKLEKRSLNFSYGL